MLAKSPISLFAIWLFSLSLQVQAAELPNFTEIVGNSADAVVKISATRKSRTSAAPDLGQNQEVPEMFRRFFEQPPQGRGGQSTGSGFFISADGYLLTNNHVIDGSDEIQVILQDRRTFEADIVGTDERSDLALLKVTAADLPFVRMGDSNELKVGEWVLAIGSPFGLDYSVAAGIVSAKGRSLPTEKGENYVPFIQTDVAINPGNSGGPLFNLDGEVVGINSQIYTRSGGSIGLSFAIPSSTALDVVAQLKADGRVVRGWLGVGIQDVNRDLAKSFGLKKPAGALVSQVVEDSPAEKGGLKVGDVIVKFNGEAIDQSGDLPHVVGRTRPDRKVDVLVYRDGKRKNLRLEVGSLGENGVKLAGGKPDKKDDGGPLGLVVLDLSDAQKSRLKLESGVVIRSLTPGKPAAAAGMRRSDVITSIDNKRVKNLAGFEALVKDLPKGEHVAVRLIRGGQPLFIALKLDD